MEEKMSELHETGNTGYTDLPSDLIPQEKSKYRWNLKGPKNRKGKMTQASKILTLSVALIIIYLILLMPYIVALNSGESGIVISTQKIDIASLPTDVQDLIPYKNLQYNAIVVDDQINSVKNLKGQNLKARKLVLSTRPAQNDEFIRADNIIINIYAPTNLIPVTNQTFDKLIIGDTNKVEYGGIIEIINKLRINPIMAASQVDFLIGGFLVVLVLTFVYTNGVALWNVPAIITCYSFQFFIAGRIASANHLETDLILLLFGLLFIPAGYLTFKVKEFEESDEGRKQILNLYRENMALFNMAVSKIKEAVNF
jgi:hypothetical protein